MPILERPEEDVEDEITEEDEPPAAVVPARRPAPRPRRARMSGYEHALTRAAILVALGITGAVWWTGGDMTLAWLATQGVPVAQLGIVAWVIPVAITLLEAGTIAGRARQPWLWLIWLAVLAFDALTTAAGILTRLAGETIGGYTVAAGDLTAWAVAGVVGIGIALAPEPAARALWNELWS